MSMTREEAAKILKYPVRKWSMEWSERDDGLSYTEALDLALTALRGPTREMVERMFPGCPYCKPDFEGYVRKFGAYSIQNGELETGHCKPQKINFCPHCSRPLTDDAVDMMLRQWKEAVDGETGRC